VARSITVATQFQSDLELLVSAMTFLPACIIVVVSFVRAHLGWRARAQFTLDVV
jgi:hypothetical protein